MHLTTCAQSSERLRARGEAAARIVEVGEPALDLIRLLEPEPPEALARELGLDLSRPIVLATQHPVTTEAADAALQITETLEALCALGLQTVFTYPNTDAGGAEMVRVLESYRGRPLLHVVPHLGSQRYMSLMKIAAVMVGNSSSGLLEAPSFKLPAVNVGTRQHGRTRACNVIDAGYDRAAIRRAVELALGDAAFRRGVASCVNPYGDGTAAAKTVDVLRRLKLTPALLAKWLPASEALLDRG
jgi:UDP-hydrolysing UDP-N-acetyl-D-glucosamine 2-epimerase